MKYENHILDVRQFLRGTINQGETVYYYPNPGNAGDALMAQAAFQIFEDLDLSVIEINNTNFDGTDKTIIYGGGGNLVKSYPHSSLRQMLENNHKKCKKFIILPHTINGHGDVLKSLGANVVIFLREKISFDYITNICNGPNIFLAEDLAFQLDVDRFLNMQKQFIPLLREARPLKRKLGLIRKFLNAQKLDFFSPNIDEICCYRTDVERIHGVTSRHNYDVSNIFRFGTTRIASLYSCISLFSFLNDFSSVKTNRLHVCIAGILLNKKVTFSANSYYKCRAIYDFSIRGVHENVIWTDVPCPEKINIL